MKFRESIRQREQLKIELEKRKNDIFWDVEYAMLTSEIKYFNIFQNTLFTNRRDST